MDSPQDPRLVYLIEDDASQRNLLTQLISSDGLAHVAYESADQFLQHYADRGPACILSDIRSPGMTGFQMLDRLRRMEIHHPIILTSAAGDVETAVRCFRGGAFDFFTKPIDGTMLLQRLHEALDSDRTARGLRMMRTRTLAAIETLSPRERQILRMLYAGRPNKAIAHELNLSEKTVAAHRAHILEKMRTDSLTELVRMLMTAQVDLSPPRLAAAA